MLDYTGQSRSMSGLYVFYQRFKGPGSEGIQAAASRISSTVGEKAKINIQVRNLAKDEFSKEKALLEKVFGVNLNFDYYGGAPGKRDGFREVIEAFNTCLNIKEIYERNLHLLLETKGEKGVFSWYPTYFMKALNEAWPRIRRKATSLMKKGGDLGMAIASMLSNEIDQICVRGIQLMLDGPELETNDLKKHPELKNAYVSLLSEIGEIKTSGSMANQIYSAYQLDQVKELLKGEILGGFNKKRAMKKAKEVISKNIYARGGFSLEAIESAIFSQIAASVKGGAIHGGDLGIKADNIVTANIDISKVEEVLPNAKGDRKSNMATFEALGKKLENIEDGFIIYSSDKNYSINGNFKGFDVGSLGADVQSFINSVCKTGSASTLLGAILQLGKGAMLEGQKAQFEEYLAQEVANMLFDDFGTIEVTGGSSGNSIHVMNLGGVMMPLSSILTLLADAIEEISTLDPRDIVNVKIHAPAIIFSTDQDQANWQKANNASAIEAWNAQRAYALANTEITAHLLKDIRGILSQYLSF